MLILIMFGTSENKTNVILVKIQEKIQASVKIELIFVGGGWYSIKSLTVGSLGCQ